MNLGELRSNRTGSARPVEKSARTISHPIGLQKARKAILLKTLAVMSPAQAPLIRSEWTPRHDDFGQGRLAVPSLVRGEEISGWKLAKPPFHNERPNPHEAAGQTKVPQILINPAVTVAPTKLAEHVFDAVSKHLVF